MFQVLYEHEESWPREGPLKIDAQLQVEITVPPEVAQQRANGYLTREVAMFIVPDTPALVLEKRPVWRMATSLQLRGLGKVAVVGSIDVDATTGKVVYLSEDEITATREKAGHVASRLTPETAPAG